ncbi:SMR family transporter [Sphingobium yanoikuyae]|jgi:quaternary ammonium compound-resistance protein SugE|uniref:Guanidinium exporter n=1 Tax=Sphingobium yanoikuyae TaxID=13690 RepID=A0A0J9CSI3_SPHYA|nr:MULTISPECIES: SMR family transporter [Sphingobium]ATP19334.1 QacE family quaternary ammonium compound efflux SMR transporter [Sphingobium yanoikuyae]KMW28138.1 molecular chaperone [Sphingobium yanoikuyae]MDH2134909.1 SMR family transporter [Sphingobium yanoikuyae]MDH2152750.1 SMR family transporter [Sphingobium yanoikuyae]MDH2170247.1 SMR family transporter [Sphingobium yanoikuyae]
MKWAATQGSWTSASFPIILNFVNVGLLAFAMRTLPAGTAYAVWTGLGAVGVAVMGVILFGERLNPVQMVFIFLVVVGVVGTKFFATA